MKKLYLDLDGTLAEWKQSSTMEDLFKKGYFLNLKPNVELINAVKLLIKSGVECFVLSAYFADSKYALKEKNLWVDKYLPEIDNSHRIFVVYGDAKTDYVDDILNSVLLDDFSKNLHDWNRSGGTCIKFLNGINNTKGSWKGTTIHFENRPHKMVNKIKSVLV